MRAIVEGRLLDLTVPPRETYSRFPLWVQPVITEFSGKPLPGTSCPLSLSPLARVVLDLTKAVVGILSTALIVAIGGQWFWLMPLAWILTVNGMVSLKLDSHYAAHCAITGNANLDRAIGEVLTALVLSSCMDEYAEGHTVQHHGMAGIGEVDDPDLALLFLMGFETGRPRSWYVWRLLLSLGSPRFHLLFAWMRLRSNFLLRRWWRSLLAIFIHGPLLLVLYKYGGTDTVVLAWILPLLVLVQISIGLQVPTEHLWLSKRGSEEAPRSFLRRISHGRFFLSPAPRRDLGMLPTLAAWLAWSFLMIRPALERSFVCVSGMPAHDYHHRHARRMDWPSEIYLRQAEIDSGAGGYTDFYGLQPAFSELFEIWSGLPAEASPRARTILSWFERHVGGVDAGPQTAC